MIMGITSTALREIAHQSQYAHRDASSSTTMPKTEMGSRLYSPSSPPELHVKERPPKIYDPLTDPALEPILAKGGQADVGKISNIFSLGPGEGHAGEESSKMHNSAMTSPVAQGYAQLAEKQSHASPSAVSSSGFRVRGLANDSLSFARPTPPSGVPHDTSVNPFARAAESTATVASPTTPLPLTDDTYKITVRLEALLLGGIEEIETMGQPSEPRASTDSQGAYYKLEVLQRAALKELRALQHVLGANSL